MKKWEYDQIWIPREPLNKVLFNERGRQGWEICAIWPHKGEVSKLDGIFVVFKRELTDDQGTRKTDT